MRAHSAGGVHGAQHRRDVQYAINSKGIGPMEEWKKGQRRLTQRRKIEEGKHGMGYMGKQVVGVARSDGVTKKDKQYSNEPLQ